MSDEVAADVGQKDTSMQKWKPAIKAGIALIAVIVAISIFELAIPFILKNYLQSLWAFWQEVDLTYPVYSAIYYLLFGVFLLGLAGLLVTKKGWYEAFFDELQLQVSREKLDYLAIGMVVGAAATIAYCVVQTLSDIYLFNVYLYIGLIPGHLGEAALLIVPLLAWSVGQVALIQGYFQRTISKNYGEVAGIIVAVSIYILLFHFPNIFTVLQSMRYPELFLVIGTGVLGSFIGNALAGTLIAYAFARSKSVYLPIGFIFAWDMFPHIYNGFVSSIFSPSNFSFQQYYPYLVSSLLHVLTAFMALAFVWYFYHNCGGDLSGLKGKLQIVADFFRVHDEDD